MLTRQLVESDYTHIFNLYKIGITAYSPLCMGILTGKYIDGTPEDSRQVKGVGSYFNHEILKTHIFKKTEDEILREKMIKLRDLSAKLGCNMG